MTDFDSLKSIGRSSTFKATLVMMALISVLLGLRFYLMLYFPGTKATFTLFKMISPFWALFGCLTFVLKSPLLSITQWLLVHFPGLLPKGFPVMPAADVMAYFTHQPLASMKLLYPGEVDWLSLAAIPFWNLLLLIFHQVGWYLHENGSFRQFAEESGKLFSRQHAETEIQQPVMTSQSIILKPPVRRLKVEPHDPRTSERLAETKKSIAQSNLVIKPVNRLDWKQYKQQEGDLMVRDMVRQLQQENSSLQAQQNQLRSTFSQYFSPQALQYLEQNKGSFLKVENEKHVISVLFCDIRGFSNYSQSASSEDVVAYLEEYFGIASHYILHKHNGIVSKLMGDGLMAYWGFPAPHADHAYTATQAALDILHEVELRNKTTPGAMPLKIGIAIATGEAIVGNIGSEDFKDFTLIGPSVNLAARLEEANKTQGTSLLISGETYNRLGGRSPCRNMGKIEIRGWQQPEQAYAPALRSLQ